MLINESVCKKMLLYMNLYQKTNKIQSFYLTSLSRTLLISWSQISKIIKELEKLKIIKTEKNGRIRFIELTDKGIRYAEKLNELNGMIQS